MPLLLRSLYYHKNFFTTMEYLQLSNRTVNGKCENLCYINASLNLLNLSTEFSRFFQQYSYLESNDLLQCFPVSAELSKIFTGAVKSAAVLRSTIAEKSKQPQFSTWNQQDITEFHRVLLDVLEKEFKRNNCRTGLVLIAKFLGREKQSLEFVTECRVCQYKPDDKIDDLDILSLDISANVTSRKLTDIVQEHFSKLDEREMRCECPDSAYKAVRVTSSLTQTPDYLVIELRRYRIVAGNQYKSIQIVRLDDVLTLPTGEEYHLMGVTDHRGTTIQSGHYVTFVRSGSDWFLVNDSIVTKVNRDYVTSQDNVLLLYSKTEHNQNQNDKIPSLSDKLRNVNMNDTSTTETDTVTEKVPCLGCGKKFKHIYGHIRIKENRSCMEKYDIDDIEEEKKKYAVFEAETLRKYKEKNPDKSAEKKRDWAFIFSNNLRNVNYDQPSTTETNTATEKVPCLCCGKKYKHIFPHIKGNGPCQEKYDIEEEKMKYNAIRAELVRMSRARSREKDPDKYAEKIRSAKSRSRSKKKEADPVGLREDEKSRQSRSRSNRKEADPEGLREDEKSRQSRSRSNRKEADPENLLEDEKSRQSRSREKRKHDDPDGLAEKEKFKRMKKKDRLQTAEGRIAAFREATRDGPCFPCICCQRAMFKKQVVIYEGKVKAKIESYEGLYEKAIERIDMIPIVRNKYYLCKTCKKYLDKNQVPPMSHCNNLEHDYPGRKINIKDDDGNKIDEYVLTKEDCDNLHLTDLEQSLIARSLIFLKIHKLPKSRMGCISDKIVYIPINENDTLNTINTILRTPSEAGILPVKVKRKLEYRSNYMEEFISIPKIIGALRVLHRVRHPEYRFLTEEMIKDYEKRCLKDIEKEKDDN